MSGYYPKELVCELSEHEIECLKLMRDSFYKVREKTSLSLFSVPNMNAMSYEEQRQHALIEKILNSIK